MRRIVGAATALVIAGLVTATPAQAATSYLWSVDGSLANSGLPAGIAPGIPLGPNVSSAKDGARIEIVGSGEVRPASSWIDGGGAYRVLSADGTVVATGRWRPQRLESFSDVGTEPEGSPIEQLRAGTFVARAEFEGLGSGRIAFLCGVHAAEGEELEGVKVGINGWRFHRIEAGSTTLEES